MRMIRKLLVPIVAGALLATSVLGVAAVQGVVKPTVSVTVDGSAVLNGGTNGHTVVQNITQEGSTVTYQDNRSDKSKDTGSKEIGTGGCTHPVGSP